MNHIRQRLPNYFDQRIPRDEGNFNTMEELLAIPFVAEYAADKNFVRFMKSGDFLMFIVQLGEARKHFVVGIFEDPSTVDLPEWTSRESNL